MAAEGPSDYAMVAAALDAEALSDGQSMTASSPSPTKSPLVCGDSPLSATSQLPPPPAPAPPQDTTLTELPRGMTSVPQTPHTPPDLAPPPQMLTRQSGSQGSLLSGSEKQSPFTEAAGTPHGLPPGQSFRRPKLASVVPVRAGSAASDGSVRSAVPVASNLSQTQSQSPRSTQHHDVDLRVYGSPASTLSDAFPSQTQAVGRVSKRPAGPAWGSPLSATSSKQFYSEIESPLVGEVPTTERLASMSPTTGHTQNELKHVQTMLEAVKTRGTPMHAVQAAFDEAMYEEEARVVLEVISAEESGVRGEMFTAERTEYEDILSAYRATFNIKSTAEKIARRERRRQKELDRLHHLKETELLRAWNERCLGASPAEEVRRKAERERELQQIQQTNIVTKQLRSRYRAEMPPFASNVQSMRERGVIADGNAVGGAAMEGGGASYQEMAAGLRRSYWLSRIDKEEREREDSFRRATANPADAHLPHMPYLGGREAASDVGAKVPGRISFDSEEQLHRYEYELAHGPIALYDNETLMGRGTPSRAPWK